MRRTLAALATTALLAAACQQGAETGTDQPVSPAPPQSPSEPGGETGNGDSSPEESPSDDIIDPAAQHPIEAVPGRWAIADAGFVEFDLDDGGLELVDVAASEGWSAHVDEESSDEIEVDFVRDNTEIQFEVEWDDGTLEVDIDTDVSPADTGAYELGQAGSMEFDVEGGGLVLRDVTVNDAWELRMDDESSDEIEFTVASGAERWLVEIELDDGEVELEIDYRASGSS